jgi:hypothetical protein
VILIDSGVIVAGVADGDFKTVDLITVDFARTAELVKQYDDFRWGPPTPRS